MAQFYTLDEAAERLGLGVDELKRRLKTEWTAIRPFRDGPTLRFRTADIDELARSLGQASDPGLTLGPPGSALADPSDEIAVPDSGHDLTGEDIFTVRGGEPKPKAPADSDVRLDIPTSKPKSGTNLQTDELSIDLGTPSSGKLTAPKSGPRIAGAGKAKIPGPEDAPASSADSSSEFELSLDADSDSFDLQLSTDSGNEVDLGAVLDAPGGASGINLGKPADSGVSLEKKKGAKPPPADGDSDVDFELSLDAGAPRSGGARKPGQPTMGDDSSSEFELTLDDNSGVAENLAHSLQAQADAGHGDIFETDFELPAVGDDSGSEVVAVSDTDLEHGGFEVEPTDDESASQVVLVDSDEAAVLDDADVVDEEAGAALAGVSRLADDDLPVQAVAAPPAPWPGWVVAPLALTLLFAFFGGLMSFESIRGMWGYHQPGKPANALVRGMADTLGMKVSD